MQCAKIGAKNYNLKLNLNYEKILNTKILVAIVVDNATIPKIGIRQIIQVPQYIDPVILVG